MDESELLFNLFYLLLSLCIIYPPEEFHHLGLTVEQMCSGIIGVEDVDFIQYHQKRTALNLCIHSCLPAIYFALYYLRFVLFENEATVDSDFQMLIWKITMRFSLLGGLAVLAMLFNWRHQNWQRHPISRTLMKFSNVQQSYRAVAKSIADEFRRSDIYKKKLNSISTVITTENWIIKTTLYNVHFAHQSDTILSVARTDTYTVSQDNIDTLQIVSIIVKPNRQGVADFNIRINALEFRNLEERINRPIVIPSTVQFHRNVIDRFIDVFKEQVAHNPIYTADLVADKCFACMNTEPNVKINKQCEDIDREGRPLSTERCCTNCYCRPMWCVDCLARWFAAKQNEHDHEVWLEQKCACPMCRANFCVLDVSYIQRTSNHAA